MSSTYLPAERLQQILDSAVDTGIIILDPDGIVISWSKGASNLLWSE
ncbi:hypothetical protein [Rhizobium bangladeshense]|nr:hypothetical protein [Rhizobium bangladeshense]